MLTDPPALTQKLGDSLYQSGTGNFNVKMYGAVGDGITDDTAAIQRACNAAYAFANDVTKRAIIEFPPAIYLVNSNINWNGTNIGKIVFRGGPATIKFGQNYAQFVNTGSLPSNTGNYGSLTIEDFIVDNNNTKKNFGSCGMIFNFDKHPTQFNSLSNITVQRCEVRNAPRGSVTDGFLIGVCIDIYTPTYTDRTTACSVTDITVQDCIFGKVGYGGSYGVQIQQNLGNGAFPTTPPTGAQIRQNPWVSACFMDNIILCRLWHDGGPPSQTYYSNSNYIVGAAAHGDRLICEDLYGNHSGDDGLEVNSFLNVDVNRCRLANDSGGISLLLNNGGGMPTPEQQVIRVRNCQFGPTDGTNGASGLYARAPAQAPHGTIIVENCQFIDAYLLFRGACKRIVVRDCNFAFTTPWTNGGFVNIYPIDLNQKWMSQAFITVENVSATYKTSYANPNNTSNSYVNFGLMRIYYLNDVTLTLRNLQVNNAMSSVTGYYGSGVTLSVVLFGVTMIANQASFDGTSNGGFFMDSGSSTDVTVSGGTLNPSNTAVLTNEIRTCATTAVSSYWDAPAGPQTDVCVEVQVTPGAITTGHLAGVVGKTVDANNFTVAYVYDDGANSLLCLDRVVGGTRSSLLGTIVNAGIGTVTTIGSHPSFVSDRGIQLSSRISTGTPFYVRYKQQGTAVHADFNATSIGYIGSVTATGSATFTSATDIAMFVETALWSGYVWVPQSLDAKIDNWNYYRMTVLNGLADNLTITHTGTTPLSGLTMLINGFTGSTSRIQGSAFRLINSGVGRHLNAAATIKDIDTLSDWGGSFRRSNWQLQNGSVNSLSAPGSGVAYTNASGYVEQIYWYGGTLTTPYVQISVNGGTTWDQIRGANSGGMAIVPPGVQIRWTYSSAPTIKRTSIS